MIDTTDHREHPGLFRKKGWRGVEVDFTAILQTIITIFIMMILVGIPQWMLVDRMERIVMNQVIIKETGTHIIDNQFSILGNLAEIRKTNSVLLSFLAIKMSYPCSQCHKEINGIAPYRTL